MNRLMFVSAILIVYCSGVNGQKAFERVETFPAGKQEGTAGSILGMKEHCHSYGVCSVCRCLASSQSSCQEV
jgi:hypothetical protein